MADSLVQVYVSGFQLLEVYKPGAVAKVSSTPAYTDDNTVACCGEDFPSGSGCDGYPVCSRDTDWRGLWSGTPELKPVENANIFSPPLCPYAYKTDTIRLDFDTAKAPGWK